MRFVRTLASVVALSLSLVATSSTIRDDRQDKQYTDLAKNFASAGMITGSNNTIASGVLIAKNWVLTSAHLSALSNTPKFAIGGNTYNITKVYKDPDYNATTDAYDLALGYIGGDGVKDIAFTPLYGGPAGLGLTGTSVGFGDTGTGLTGATTKTSDKRAFNNVLDVYDNASTAFQADFDSPDGKNNKMGSKNPVDLEGCGAPGDSGSGLFATVDGTLYQLGVQSYVDFPEGTTIGKYGNVTGWTAIRGGQAWITKISGVNVVPEPSPLLGLGLLILPLLSRRRS